MALSCSRFVRKKDSAAVGAYEVTLFESMPGNPPIVGDIGIGSIGDAIDHLPLGPHAGKSAILQGQVRAQFGNGGSVIA